MTFSSPTKDDLFWVSLLINLIFFFPPTANNDTTNWDQDWKQIKDNVSQYWKRYAFQSLNREVPIIHNNLHSPGLIPELAEKY